VLHQLNLCALRSLVTVPITVMQVLTPKHSVKERQPVVMLPDANGIHVKPGRLFYRIRWVSFGLV
jgi:hypothetical protein